MITYTGLFLDKESMKKLRQQETSLEKTIKDMHVTLEYMPKSLLPQSLIGKEFDIEVIGEGKNKENSGFEIKLPPELAQYYHGAATPHITTSVSDKGKPVNTAKLNFNPIEHFTIRAKMGYFKDGSPTFKN